MNILHSITTEELLTMANQWADKFDVPMEDKEVEELLRDNFINGFLAGSIQMHAIIDLEEKKKEAE